MNLKSTDTMERITRQELVDRFDEILYRISKEDIGFVILNPEGKDGEVLCPASWFESESNDINSIMDNLKARKEQTYQIVEQTIKKIEGGEITDTEGIEDFKYLLMDYGDDCRFFELYRSLCEVLKKKYPELATGKWE